MVLSLFSDVDDDRRALISVERNIANIERSLSASTTGNGGGGGGGNGETLLTASLADGAVVRNHHSDAARGLGKLFPGGRSSSMGRDSRITQIIIISLSYHIITFNFEEGSPLHFSLQKLHISTFAKVEFTCTYYLGDLPTFISRRLATKKSFPLNAVSL